MGYSPRSAWALARATATFAVALSWSSLGCSLDAVDARGDEPTASRTARPARIWSSTRTTLSLVHSSGPQNESENEPGGVSPEIPTVRVSTSTPTTNATSEVTSAARKPVPLAESAVSPPRPVEVPWTSGAETAAASSTEDETDDEARPVRIPGRLRDVAPQDPSRFPAGLRPGPCCLRNPKQCAEFVAASKIEGTLASRAVASAKLRATPFGKPAQ
jgi:hypothetical protein